MTKISATRPFGLIALCALGLAVAAPAYAQAPAAAAGPAVSQDPAAAPAGEYNIDLNHSSVIARIAHGGGVSYSTLRFGVTKGVLAWDPANPERIKLDVAVDAKPHYEPIRYRIAPDGAPMLNVAQFPQATFTSTSVRRTGPNKADVSGNLTLLGVAKPAVIHVELVGAGKNNQGVPVIGFTGSMEIKRSDFGTPFLPNAIGDNVTLVLDGEFIKAGA